MKKIIVLNLQEYFLPDNSSRCPVSSSTIPSEKRERRPGEESGDTDSSVLLSIISSINMNNLKNGL